MNQPELTQWLSDNKKGVYLKSFTHADVIEAMEVRVALLEGQLRQQKESSSVLTERFEVPETNEASAEILRRSANRLGDAAKLTITEKDNEPTN